MKYIKDFRVVSCPNVVGISIHPLYIKENLNRNSTASEKKNNKVLFVGNIDFHGLEDSTTVEFLSSTFGVFGTVESIHVSSQGNSGGVTNWYCEGAYTTRNSLSNPNITKLSRFAHITFEKKAGLKFALTASDEFYNKLLLKSVGEMKTSEIQMSMDSKEFILDVCSRYTTYAQKERSVNGLKHDVFETLKMFEEQERENLNNSNPHTGFGQAAMDDDGFEIVKAKKKKRSVSGRTHTKHVSSALTQHTRQTQALQHIDTSTVAAAEDEEATVGNKKRKAYELTNFYSFQKRESKEKILLQLRKKFEQDKEKIALMKSQRKFKAL